MTTISLLLATLAVLGAPEEQPNVPWVLQDINGVRHQPFDRTNTLGIVFVFVSTDCPIANSYQPLIQRLAAKYAEKGVQFYVVHPSPSVTAEAAREHAKAFHIQSPVVLDSDQSIAKRAGAKVTPEVFLFVRGEREAAYRGRIDNQYATFGKKRRAPTTNDLDDALAELASKGSVTPRSTKAVGCFISFGE